MDAALFLDPFLVMRLDGPAVGKGRPRFSRKSGVAFTPAKTRRYETELKGEAQRAMGGRALVEGPVRVDIRISCLPSDSWAGWKRAAALAGEVRPTSKPDMDNVLKAVLDAFNGVVWKDDMQAVSISMTKLYATAPGIVVEVYELQALPSQVTKRPANQNSKRATA